MTGENVKEQNIKKKIKKNGNRPYGGGTKVGPNPTPSLGRAQLGSSALLSHSIRYIS